MTTPEFLFKIHERLLPAKDFFPSRGSSKHALFAYQRTPRIELPGYYRYSHNNRLTSKCFVQALVDLGYNVTVIDWLASPPPGRTFDLVIGHGPKYLDHFHAASDHGIKVLLLTGANPDFGNAAQEEREELLRFRKGLSTPSKPKNLVTYLTSAISDCDFALLIGNEWTKSTYTQNVNSKIQLIPNVSPFKPRLKNRAKQNRYIFLSSVGQVHRGLDLTLEAFAKMNHQIHILSDFSSEADFCQIYKNELYSTKNIKAIGRVNTNSLKFNSIVREVDFCVLPSCSEGQSGSLINLMTLGVLPISTVSCGVTHNEFGFTIDSSTPECIQRCVEQSANLSDLDVKIMRERMYGDIIKYQPDRVTHAIKEKLAHNLS